MMCTEDTEPIKHLCNLDGHFNIVSLQESLIFLILTKKKDCVLFHKYEYFLELSVCYTTKRVLYSTLQPFEMIECNICLSAKDTVSLHLKFCLLACLSFVKSN